MKRSLFGFILLVAVALSNGTQAQNAGDILFDDSYVHTIELQFYFPEFWDTLEYYYTLLDPWVNPEPIKKYLPADITIDGISLDSVGVRQKGFFSNWGAMGALKKPLKVDINEFVSGQKLDGLKKFNLQNAFLDPSLMRDKMSYDLMRKAGIPAPRSAYANVYLNGTHWGLYLMVEQVDKTFLRQHFEDEDGNLYKCIESTNLNDHGSDTSYYKIEFGKRSNEEEDDWADLIHFVDVLNNTPNALVADSLRKVFNIDAYFKVLAIDLLIQNWDSYIQHGRNLYLYHHPGDGKFHWIPWDYNLSWSNQPFDMIYAPPFNEKPLLTRIVETPALREAYLDSVCVIMNKVFVESDIHDRIDSLKSIIQTHVYNDPNKFYTNANFDSSLVTNVMGEWDDIPGLKPMTTERIGDFQAQLAAENKVCPTTTTSIDPETATELLIYPNPAQNILQIEWKGQNIKVAKTQVYNSLGQVIFCPIHQKTNGLELDLTQMQEGMYFLEIQHAAGMIQKAFVKVGD